jgi:NTE family protein
MKILNLIIVLICIIVLSPFSISGKESKKVVLVLGSGGSKGLAHVGVIEELELLGIVPDVIVGCSSGAIVGALYAQNQDVNKVKEILIDMKYDDLVDFSFFQKNAFSKRGKLENFLKDHLTVTDFSSMKTRFIAVATDLDKGEPVYFEKGELHPAVLASSALPVLFAPYKIGDKLYVDGGVSDPLPTHFNHNLKDVIVIASDISPSLDGFDSENLLQVVRKSFEVMYQRLSYFSRPEADILLEMNFTDLDSPIADDANQEIYQKGKEAVQKSSQEILEKVFN